MPVEIVHPTDYKNLRPTISLHWSVGSRHSRAAEGHCLVMFGKGIRVETFVHIHYQKDHSSWILFSVWALPRDTQHLSIWWWERDRTYCVLLCPPVLSSHLTCFSNCDHQCNVSTSWWNYYISKVPGSSWWNVNQISTEAPTADSCWPPQWLQLLPEHPPPCQHCLPYHHHLHQ